MFVSTLLTVLAAGVVLIKLVHVGIEILKFIAHTIHLTIKRMVRQVKRNMLALLVELKNLAIEGLATSYFALISKIEQ